jgi:nucleotide-binding universal stress UspA family protein
VYEKILVPLDGSKRAEMIRPHVRGLASRFQATVILIMGIDHIYADGIGETYINRSESAFNAKLKDNELYLEGIASRFRDRGIACQTRVAQGPVVEKIIEAANTEDADLIAMTSHGWGGACPHFLRQCCRGYIKPDRSPAFYRSVPVGRINKGNIQKC